MGHSKLTVLVQDFSGGITGGLVWRDVTTACKSIAPSTGLDAPRGFMPKTGTCTYTFKNPDGSYTPVPNREDASAYILDVGRRIQHRVTLPTHGKALKVTYTTGATINAGYLAQTGIAATVAAKEQLTLQFQARCESGFLRNALRAEIRTDAPETCVGQVFELTCKWRTYRLTTLVQSSASGLEVRFYNCFTGDETNIEFKNMSLVASGGAVNVLTNPTFSSGTTGWSVTNAAMAGINDYDIRFNGIIQSIVPQPFATTGARTTTVVATDWVAVLKDSTAKFPLQENQRADQLIETVLANLPAKYWVQAPPGKLIARGHQLFEKAFTGYTEKETSLFQAISEAVESENGIFWCDLDGTFRFENNTFHSRRQLREGVPRAGIFTFQANPVDGDAWLCNGSGSEQYTFKNTLGAQFDVKIGTTAKDSAQNLVDAINYDADTLGTSYDASTQCNQTTVAEMQDWSSVVLEDTPDTWLRVGESSGTDAADSSGNGHTSTYVNGVTLGTTGAIFSDSDTGVTLDGTNDNISVPSTSLYFTSFTIELWLKAGASPTATQDVFSAYSAFADDQAFYIRINSNGSITVDFYNDSYTTGTGKITFGGSSYQHVVVTYDKDTDLTTIYVDGLQVGQASIGYFNSTTSPTITVGGFPAAGSNYYKGALDEFALYKTALTEQRVAVHYSARYVSVKLTHYRNINETNELTLTEGNKDPYYMQPVRSLRTLINKCAITWRPRTTSSGLVTLGQIQAPVQIPPKQNITNASFVKPGYSNPDDGRIGTQKLTITFRDDAGNTISGKDILDPVATTDYRIYEQRDATGYEYTTQTSYFWISDIEKNASQFTCTLNNNAIGALYATTFQVRGKSITSYDEQEELSLNQTSIDLYRERQLRRTMPFTNDQQFCKSLSEYTVERYGYPFVEAGAIDVDNRDTLNSQYLLGFELMDTVIITDIQGGLPGGVRHMIVGIESTLAADSTYDYVEHIRFVLERLDQNQYFLLNSSTQGVLDGVNRLYI